MPAGHIIYTYPSSLYATVLFKNDGTSAGTISGNILTAVPTRRLKCKWNNNQTERGVDDTSLCALSI